MTSEDLTFDQQRGGGKMMAGGGETQLEKAKRRLVDTEVKIKKSLLHIKSQRTQVRAERKKQRIPQVALVGYTNAGRNFEHVLAMNACSHLEHVLVTNAGGYFEHVLVTNAR